MFRASCLALWLWTPLQQSRRHIRVCQAEWTLESQQGSGGLLGNPELPSSENRWCFSSRKVSSATFTSSECTWKDIKVFSPPVLLDILKLQIPTLVPALSGGLIHVFKITLLHQSSIFLCPISSSCRFPSSPCFELHFNKYPCNWNHLSFLCSLHYRFPHWPLLQATINT